MYYGPTTASLDPWGNEWATSTRLGQTIWVDGPAVASTSVIVWTFPAAGDSDIARGVLRRFDPRLERLRRLAARIGQDAADFALAVQRAEAMRPRTPLALRAAAYPPQVVTTRSPGGVLREPWAPALRAFVGVDTFRRRRPKRARAAS